MLEIFSFFPLSFHIKIYDTDSWMLILSFLSFQGKNKKNKKSKMLKVDSRILGFNVTSAPDRINVGDRDYGDNS